MAEDGTAIAASEARRMLDIFASVGAHAVDVTWTTSAGAKEQFRRNLPLADFARTMPAILDHAARRQRNVIVRPHGPGMMFLQLDDLAGDQLARVAPLAFVVIETSPGNHQAWLAMPGRVDKAFARRLRQGTGADPGASGATRIAGSLNLKDKYAPNFPRVIIREAQPGRQTNAAELESLGLVAAPEKFAPLPPARFTSPRKAPSYQKALDGAPLNSEGTGPDRSKADYVFAMTCLSWGFTRDETAARLMQEDSKARQLMADPKNGQRLAWDYALLTATKAAEAVQRRQQKPRLTLVHSRG